MRPQLVVVTKSGQRYDANHIFYAKDWQSPEANKYKLLIVCSGGLSQFNADDIAGVEFTMNGATHCNECDKQL